MNRFAIALAAALAVPMLAAHAETPDLSGQFAISTQSNLTRAQVQADLAQFNAAGVDPWSISYNPLANFQGEKTRAEVRAEYLADRDGVAAMNGEDSGSAYLAQSHRTVQDGNRFAGTPANLAR